MADQAQISSSRRAEFGVMAVFLLAALLPRLPAFFRSVLDWDESLYFLMAAQWLAGHLPYTGIWDNKPVGIYAIFAVFEAVFGEKIAAIRMATVVFVGFGGYIVRNITRRIIGHTAPNSNLIALMAGGVFMLCSITNDGLAANTELFMAFFTTSAVCIALLGERFVDRPAYHGCVVGLFLGCAFMVKYVAVFEAPAVFLLVVSQYGGNARLRAGFTTILAAGLPLSAAAVLYWQAGDLSLWWEDSVLSNLRRVTVNAPAGALTNAFVTQFWRWGPLYFAGLLTLVAAAWELAASRRLRRNQLCLSLWLIGGGVGIASAKSFYDHYFLQILPVLCVMLGWLLSRFTPQFERWSRWFLAALLIAFLGLPAFAAVQAVQAVARPVLAFGASGLTVQPDTPMRIASDIRPLLATTPGASIYVFDFQPILYSLAGVQPPTRFVLPSVLTKTFLPGVAGVDPPAEIKRIMSGRPLFVVCSRPSPTEPKLANNAVYAEMASDLATHYQLWGQYRDATVFRLVN